MCDYSGRIPTTTDDINVLNNKETDNSGRFSKKVLTHKYHNWTEPLIQGPWDIGFNESYITIGGIQSAPFAFLRNSKFQQKDMENIIYWNKGAYRMPFGRSRIGNDGEGSADWDSTAYNMIVVNETEKFLHRHMENNPNQPFLTYVALGAVHVPHSPPNRYIDGSKISGQYATRHMDLLNEMDKVVGSLIKILEDKELIEDTIIVFTSDNGGLGRMNGSQKEGHLSSGPLRGSKGSIYEGGHRIPMIIRWDKGMIPKGESRGQIVGLNDLFATLCDFCGIEVPKNQASDSVSFADYAKDENIGGSRESYNAWRYKRGRLKSTSVNKNGWKLVYNHRKQKSELFNLLDDVGELHDLSGKNRAKVQELLKEMKLSGPCVDEVGNFDVFDKKSNKFDKRNCNWFKITKRCQENSRRQISR